MVNVVGAIRSIRAVARGRSLRSRILALRSQITGRGFGTIAQCVCRVRAALAAATALRPVEPSVARSIADFRNRANAHTNKCIS